MKSDDRSSSAYVARRRRDAGRGRCARVHVVAVLRLAAAIYGRLDSRFRRDRAVERGVRARRSSAVIRNIRPLRVAVAPRARTRKVRAVAVEIGSQRRRDDPPIADVRCYPVAVDRIDRYGRETRGGRVSRAGILESGPRRRVASARDVIRAIYVSRVDFALTREVFLHDGSPLSIVIGAHVPARSIVVDVPSRSSGSNQTDRDIRVRSAQFDPSEFARVPRPRRVR